MADQTPQEKREQARVRRRWLTLGEILAVLAVAISALTFWNSYRERTNAEAEKQAESSSSAKKAATLILKASADSDGRALTLTPRSEDQAIQSQTVRFPTALGVSPAETSGDARIDRGWFASGLVKARKEAHATDQTAGDARLPVLIETQFLVNGEPHTDRAVYTIGYATTHSLFGGTEVKLHGLARSASAASAAAGVRQIDALWKTMLPVRRQ
jgi:hypothetical protein